MNKKTLVYIGVGVTTLAALVPIIYMTYKKRMCDFDDAMYAFLTDDEKEDI